ncbi:MAG: tandem-95 repeat protein [Acidobacteria bacterium]|nr:tandem-95 repeat protein [Acidobacteriota bacterium]
MALAVASGAAQEIPDLFRDPTKVDGQARVAMQTAGDELPPEFRLVRSRMVQVDSSILDPESPNRPSEVRFNFFPDSSYDVSASVSNLRDAGQGFEWFGSVADGQPAQAVLSVVDGRVNGSLSTPQAFFQISHVEGDLHIVQELLIDLPPSEDALVPNLPAASSSVTAKAEVNPTVAAGGPTTLDVLVCYTTLTRQTRGGSQAVQDKILLAISEANAGFVNSNVNLSFRLAGMVEVPGDTGSGIAEAPTREYIEDVTYSRPDIQALRDYYGADLVSVWVNGTSGAVVGIGWVYQGGLDFADAAYGVVSYPFAVGPGFTFSHEAGHNMGSAHDRENAGVAGFYPYSYGYRKYDADPKFKTIMAYSNGCSGCVSLNQWSNPNINVTLNNATAPGGVASGDPAAADNAQSLNNLAASLAAFRPTTNPPANNPPEPQGQNLVVPHNTPVPVTLFAYDADGDPISFDVTTQPAHGAVTGTGPNRTYLPAQDYSGPDSFVFEARDNRGGFAKATVNLTVQAATGGPGGPTPPKAETVVLSDLTDTWRTVSLTRTYVSPIVVCTPEYTSATPPEVPRVRNLGSSSFQVQLARFDGLTDPLAPRRTFCLVVEEGVYNLTEHGVKMEAVQYVSTTTDRRRSWVGTARTYANAYTNPIVLGQVISANDAKPSVFWAHGSTSSYPPSSDSLFTGKHVGEDPVTTRANETVGYIVFEQGVSALGSVSIETGRGTGVSGYQFGTQSYPISIATSPQGAVLSPAGMNGGDGGWPVLMGPDAVQPNLLQTVFDEDQAADTERGHAAEQVAYAAWIVTPTQSNQQPTANAQSVTAAYQTAKAITLSGTDPDQDPLTYAVVTPPAHGSLSGTAPNVTYTPAAGYSGPDSLVFSVDDGRGGYSQATVSITVGEPVVSSGPAAEGLTLAGVTDAWQWVTLGGSYVSPVVVCTPEYGAGVTPRVARIRNLNATGFELQVVRLDGLSGSTPATQTYCLVVEEGVYTKAQHGMKLEAKRYSSTVTDRLGSWAGEKVSYSNAYTSPVVVGQVMTANDGAWSSFWARGLYSSFPPNGSNLWLGKMVGEDPNGSRAGETLGYIVFEAGGGTLFGSLQIEAGLATGIGGFGNAPPYGIGLSSAPTGAVLSPAGMNGGDGGWPMLFGPNAVQQQLRTAFDEDQLKDSERAHSEEKVGYVAWTSTGPGANQPPTANPQSVQAAYQTATPITLTGSDPDQDPLTFTIVSSPAHGSLTGAAPNVTYTPTAGYSGPDGFAFTVDDGQGGSSQATVSITVGAGPNQQPTANPQSVNVAYQTPKALTLSGTDPDQDPLTYAIVTSPAHGSLSGAAPNVTYTPAAGYSGPDGLAFSVSDGRGGSSQATVSITVGAPVTVNAPTAEGLIIAGATSVWQTVTLENAYASPVVVCTPEYASGAAPRVARIRNLDGAGFELQVARLDGKADPTPATRTYCLAVEEGVYNKAQHGMKLEAKRYSSTVTDRLGSWVGEKVSYSNSYTSPVVVGQVMTANDAAWSSFWARGLYSTFPPNGSNLWLGKMVGEDPNGSRVGETLGYIVFEAGVGAFGSLNIEAGVASGIGGFGSAPPYNITLASAPTGAVLSPAGMTGGDGGWPMLFGPDAVQQKLRTAFDEDQLKDSERAHAGELVGYVAWTSNTAGANQPPTANPQTVATNRDATVEIVLTASDPDLDPLTFTIDTPPLHGLVNQASSSEAILTAESVLAGNQPRLVYTPEPGYVGVDNFVFRVEDGKGGMAQAKVDIDVEEPPNSLPTAGPQTLTTSYETALLITLGGNDPDSDPLTFGIDTPPAHGVLSGSAPTVTYTPNAGYSGPDSFVFHVDDGNGGTAQGTVSITVGAAPNQDPTADGQSLTTPFETALAITLTGSDPDQDALSFGIDTATAHGVLSGQAPTLTYTPDAGYSGPDSFVFHVDDGNRGVAQGTVSITVGPAPNRKPTADGQSLTTPFETALAITLTGSDPDQDALSFGIDTAPAHGVLSGQAPTLTYTPDAGYSGPDSFVFDVDDGNGGTAQATVTIGVGGAPNQKPTADGQSLTTPFETALAITLTGSDPDQDALSFGVDSATAHGVLSGQAPTLTYTPDAGYSGPDSFVFHVDDGKGGSAQATVSITVGPAPNRKPTANPQTLTTAYQTALPITLSGTDPDGDPLTYAVDTPPSHGSLSGAAPSLTYTPAAGYSGSDSFVFHVDDGQGGTAQATVSISVSSAQNAKPTANPQSLTAYSGRSLGIVLTGSDPDSDPLTFSIATAPAHGALSGVAPNVTYTPTGTYLGPDAFIFSVSDGRGGTSQATVSLTVATAPPNKNPVIDLTGWITDVDVPVAITLRATDADGDAITFSIIRQPYNGKLTGSGENVVYTPNPGYAGGDSFVVQAMDTWGGYVRDNIAVSVRRPTNDRQVVISTAQELLNALRFGAPGEEYLLAPGTYSRDGVFTTGDYGLLGLPDHPIVFRAQDPTRPPTITGNLLLQSPQHVKFQDVRFTNPPAGHNVNIYPNFGFLPHDVEFENVFFQSAAALTSEANIKVAKMDNLVVRNCTFKGWGDEAIDTVAVWGGLIENNQFIGLSNYRQRTSLQLKGDSRDIIVRNNYFQDGGDRVIQIGGSTDAGRFRGPAEFEATNIEVYGNRMVGGLACFSLSTQTGSRFHHNTCYLPTLFVGRLLQENKNMLPNQKGTIDHNLFVYPNSLNLEFLNVGDGVDYQSFVFESNAFYQVDGDNPYFPHLPVVDPDIVDQINPELIQPGTAKMRIGSINPVFQGIGADAVNPVN